MNTAHPATRAAFAASEVRDGPFDMLLSDLRRLDRFNPANPFVARQRRDIFPSRQGSLLGCQGFPQIRRQFVDHACGNNLFAHKGILQISRPKSSAHRRKGWVSVLRLFIISRQTPGNWADRNGQGPAKGADQWLRTIDKNGLNCQAS